MYKKTVFDIKRMPQERRHTNNKINKFLSDLTSAKGQLSPSKLGKIIAPRRRKESNPANKFNSAVAFPNILLFSLLKKKQSKNIPDIVMSAANSRVFLPFIKKRRTITAIRLKAKRPHLNILITKPPKDLHGTIPILLQTDIVSELNSYLVYGE